VIVVDASAAIAYLIDSGEEGQWVRETVRREGEVAAPHLIDVEVVSALRHALRRRDVTPRQADDALSDFESFAMIRYPMTGFLSRIWALRSTVTPYDAAYVALSEALDVALVTTDLRLAHSRGHGAEIITPA
jgi:predicted nucleic acid-binding protein